MYDLYIMDYISQSLTHCSKSNLQRFLQCTKFPDKQNNGLISQKNCSSIKQRYMKIGDGLQRKRGKNKHKCPMFDNNFLASSNQMKLCTTDYILQSNRTTYIITILCVLCLVDWWLTTSLWIYLQRAQKNYRHHIRSIFFRFQDDTIHLYKGSMQDLHGKGKMPIQKGHYVRIITLKLKNW